MLIRILNFAGLTSAMLILAAPLSRCYKNTSQGYYGSGDTVFITTDTNVDLSKGLVVYYPFHGNAADSSGNHNDGTLMGNVQFTSDKDNHSNNAALFDGSSGYIQLDDAGNLSPANFSIALQFYTTDTVLQDLCSKINFSNSNSITWGLALFNYNTLYKDYASFAVRSPDSACGKFDPVQLDDLVYSMIPIEKETWYQLTCVFDEHGVEKLYLNGILHNAITRPFTQAKQCTDASILLGAWYQAAPLYFKGKIDEFRFYNRALNDEEAAALAQGF